VPRRAAWQEVLVMALLIVAFAHQQVSFELAQAKGLLLIGLLAGARWRSQEPHPAKVSQPSPLPPG
jgi:hypothetical protein